MKVSITASTYDINGVVEFDSSDDTGERRRRFNKVQVLDGGIAVNDRGYNDGDRELTFTFNTISLAHNALCNRLVELYDTVTVSIDDGAYSAAPLAFTGGEDESTFTLSILAKLS